MPDMCTSVLHYCFNCVVAFFRYFNSWIQQYRSLANSRKRLLRFHSCQNRNDLTGQTIRCKRNCNLEQETKCYKTVLLSYLGKMGRCNTVFSLYTRWALPIVLDIFKTHVSKAGSASVIRYITCLEGSYSVGPPWRTSFGAQGWGQAPSNGRASTFTWWRKRIQLPKRAF